MKLNHNFESIFHKLFDYLLFFLSVCFQAELLGIKSFIVLQMKIDHPEPLQSSLFTAPPIPRITVKLEPPAQSAASTSKATIKKETVAGYVFPCQKNEGLFVII